MYLFSLFNKKYNDIDLTMGHEVGGISHFLDIEFKGHARDISIAKVHGAEFT